MITASAKGAETAPLVRPRGTSNRLRRLCCWSTSLFQLSQSGSHPEKDSIRRPGTQTHELSIGLLTVISSCLYYTELQHKDGVRHAHSCEALPHLIDRSHLPVHGCAEPPPLFLAKRPDEIKRGNSGILLEYSRPSPAKPAQSEGSRAGNPSRASPPAPPQAIDENRHKTSITKVVEPPARFSGDSFPSLRGRTMGRRLSGQHFWGSPVFSSHYR
jgi:hypothetical protein